MALSFEDIQVDGDGYDLAMEYLSEITELKDSLEACHQKLVKENTFRRATQNLWDQQRDKIAKLRAEVIDKDEEIGILKSKIRELSTRDSSKLQPPSRLTSKFVDPDEITFKTRTLLIQIHQDHEEYQRTGKHENIDERIAEVRRLFNLLLLQLNDLNQKNKAVTRTLDALTKLDVRKIYHQFKVITQFFALNRNQKSRCAASSEVNQAWVRKSKLQLLESFCADFW